MDGPLLVKIELLLRQTRKVCRQGGVVPPCVEIKMPLQHYDMLEKYVDKNQGNGCPLNGVPTLFSMGGATVFLELEQPKCRCVLLIWVILKKVTFNQLTFGLLIFFLEAVVGLPEVQFHTFFDIIGGKPYVVCRFW